MKSFKEFYTDNFITESVNKVLTSKVFSVFGKDYIDDTFNSYDVFGIIPKTKDYIDRETGDFVSEPITDKEREKLDLYIFKFVDEEVRQRLSILSAEEGVVPDEVYRHYKDLNTFNVSKDSETIHKVLKRWLFLANEGISGLPGIGSRINFDDLKEISSATLKQVENG